MYAHIRSLAHNYLFTSLATQLLKEINEKKNYALTRRSGKAVAVEFRMTSKKKKKTITTTARTQYQAHSNKCRKKVQVTQKYNRNETILYEES